MTPSASRLKWGDRALRIGIAGWSVWAILVWVVDDALERRRISYSALRALFGWTEPGWTIKFVSLTTFAVLLGLTLACIFMVTLRLLLLWFGASASGLRWWFAVLMLQAAVIYLYIG